MNKKYFILVCLYFCFINLIYPQSNDSLILEKKFKVVKLCGDKIEYTRFIRFFDKSCPKKNKILILLSEKYFSIFYRETRKIYGGNIFEVNRWTKDTIILTQFRKNEGLYSRLSIPEAINLGRIYKFEVSKDNKILRMKEKDFTIELIESKTVLKPPLSAVLDKK